MVSRKKTDAFISSAEGSLPPPGNRCCCTAAIVRSTSLKRARGEVCTAEAIQGTAPHTAPITKKSLRFISLLSFHTTFRDKSLYNNPIFFMKGL